MLSSENMKQVQEAVKLAGAELNGKLPSHPGLTRRNSYAHLWERLKHHMGKSYKECDNSQIAELLYWVDYYRSNPC